MAPSEVQKLMEELRTWVDAEYGRRADLARELDVPRQRITDWLSGRKAPTLEQGLTILAILAKTKLESMTRPVIPVIQPKNPQVVPVLNGPVRFAVVNSEAVTSNSWRCWAEQKGDVYIACRDNFKECKVSLHASGSWQMGFTEEGYKKCSHLLPENRIRHWQIWPKPLPIAPDVVMVFKLLFASSEILHSDFGSKVSGEGLIRSPVGMNVYWAPPFRSTSAISHRALLSFISSSMPLIALLLGIRLPSGRRRERSR